MVNMGKFKSYLSIAEAALVWEGIPLELLHGAAYVRSGVPMIVGHPDVPARAEALIEATDRGTLIECSRIDPDMRLPEPENRRVSRQALMDWIQQYWPEEMPGKRKLTIHEQPTMRAPEPEDRLLTGREAWEMLGIEKATFYRRRKLPVEQGGIPAPNETNPNRWRLGVIQGLVKGEKPATNADQPSDDDEDI